MNALPLPYLVNLAGLILVGTTQGEMIGQAHSDLIPLLRRLPSVWIVGRPRACWGDAVVSNFMLHWFPAKTYRPSLDWTYSFWLGTASAAPVPQIAMTPTASGDAQSGTVGNPLANPLRVVVTLSGSPQQGVSVTWATTGTGSAMTPPTSLTDASGIATSTWTLNQTAGSRSAACSPSGAGRSGDLANQRSQPRTAHGAPVAREPERSCTRAASGRHLPVARQPRPAGGDRDLRRAPPRSNPHFLRRVGLRGRGRTRRRRTCRWSLSRTLYRRILATALGRVRSVGRRRAPAHGRHAGACAGINRRTATRARR